MAVSGGLLRVSTWGESVSVQGHVQAGEACTGYEHADLHVNMHGVCGHKCEGTKGGMCLHVHEFTFM